MQAVAALRGQFGGHQVMTIAEGEKLRAEARRRPGQRRRRHGEGRPQGEADRESPKAAAAKGRKAASAGPSSGAAPRVEPSGAGVRRPDLGHRLDAEARRQEEPERRVHVRHLTVADFRSYTERRAAARAGRHDARRPERTGQDQPRRGDRLPRDAVQPPGRHRRAARAVRREPGGHPRRRGARRPRDDGRARDQPRAGPTGPGSTGRPLTRPRDVLGTLRTVLFAPEDLALVKGDPSERRRFLDDLLVARQPRWAGVRADYDKILKQRSALLKSAAPVLRRGGRRAARGPASEGRRRGRTSASRRCTPSTSGTRSSPRSAPSCSMPGCGCCATSRPYLGKAYDEVSAGQSDAQVSLQGVAARGDLAAGSPPARCPRSRSCATELLASLAEVRGQEIERGVCLVGPHRDDVVLTLGELPAKGYASHGESWSFALGLKLAAYQLLRHDLGDDPVLVLDDVFAELDTGRRERLAAMVADCEQVLITAAVDADVPRSWRGRTYAVIAGEVTARA